MNTRLYRFASPFAVLVGMAALTTPLQAESFASSASSATSTAVGSLSDSLRGSSNSSSGKTQTAQGDYRVLDVAQAPDRPGMIRLTLQAVERHESRLAEFTLDVPQQALATRTVTVGQTVVASARPYGIEFALAVNDTTREAFFLALADDWHRSLDARALSL